jgi:hypothetical protein
MDNLKTPDETAIFASKKYLAIWPAERWHAMIS